MSKNTKRNHTGVLALLLIGVAGASALAYYVKSGHEKIPADALPPPVSESAQPTPNPPTPQASEVGVLVPSAQDMDLKFTVEKRAAPAGVDPKVFAVNEYLRQVPAVPEAGRLLSVEMRGRTAVLTFSHEFGVQTYGSFDEKIVLDGIRATLGQFDDVDDLRMQADGKPIDSLGHVDLSEPMTVMKLSTDGTAMPIEAPKAP